MPSVLSEFGYSLEVRRWWRALSRTQRSELVRSRVRDEARDRAIETGRALSREIQRSSRREPRVRDEDPRHWSERDYYEYRLDRAPPLRHSWRFDVRLRLCWHSAPNLLAVVPDAWDGID
ncbi:hypothetical protein J5226_22020 [Lysobacter sp. K5869]|uniref:hypothetical protein n=1 Tax=Lysobacter sp. K5869 TaxID=2820808 RepID=UPI001C061BF7|nr:hypothetical protein [Lysobacter sp. K5869]QWP76234.1 hypothetical protein J5226_22020 [Lysobacter sp. K5869]